MPNNIPPLYEAQIRAHCGEQSIERGRGYFHNGAILTPERKGTTIRAFCTGTAETPYRVRVIFDDRGIASARCTCPIGHGGTCKHVAALLLNWLQRPDDFLPGEDLSRALEKRSKSELVALLTHIFQRYPALEELLELPLPGASSKQPIDRQLLRRQAAAVFAEHGDDWTATSAIADGLNSLVVLGDNFRSLGNVATASAVYGAVTEEIVTRYRRSRYGERALIEVVDRCLEGLEASLARATTEREAIFDTLLTIFIGNRIHAPDLDLGYERAGRILTEQTSQDEKLYLAERVRASIGEETGAAAALLFELEKGSLDDETFLAVCRESGNSREIVGRLLGRGRVAEAARELEAMTSHSLLLLADSFLERGHGDVLEGVVRQRLTRRLDPDLLHWLVDRMEARGELNAALRYAEQVFDLAPSLEHYRELRDLARQIHQWDALREGVFGRLNTAQYRRLLVRVLFEDGEIERAVIATSALRNDGDERLLLEIARAAEERQPDGALAIYKRLAEWRIGQRGSENYRAARALLDRVRSVYERLEQRAEWVSYAAELRCRTGSLRSLQDEIDVASL